MSDEHQIHIVIDPTPSDQEKVAIAATVVALSRNVPDDGTVKPVKPVNRWREAGKRESMRNLMWEKDK